MSVKRLEGADMAMRLKGAVIHKMGDNLIKIAECRDESGHGRSNVSGCDYF